MSIVAASPTLSRLVLCVALFAVSVSAQQIPVGHPVAIASRSVDGAVEVTVTWTPGAANRTVRLMWMAQNGWDVGDITRTIPNDVDASMRVTLKGLAVGSYDVQAGLQTTREAMYYARGTFVAP